jgi:hypothetical protein
MRWRAHAGRIALVATLCLAPAAHGQPAGPNIQGRGVPPGNAQAAGLPPSAAPASSGPPATNPAGTRTPSPNAPQQTTVQPAAPATPNPTTPAGQPQTNQTQPGPAPQTNPTSTPQGRTPRRPRRRPPPPPPRPPPRRPTPTPPLRLYPPGPYLPRRFTPQPQSYPPSNLPPDFIGRSPPPPDPTRDGAIALSIDWLGAYRDADLPDNRRRLDAIWRFVQANRSAIDSLSLPVLLPSDPALLADAEIYPHGDFYTLSLNARGLSLVITGHARAFPLSPSAAAQLPGQGLGALIPADGVSAGQSEAGFDASFRRWGAVYGLSIECATLEADPRCSDQTYLRGLMAEMAIAMPRQGR